MRGIGKTHTEKRGRYHLCIITKARERESLEAAVGGLLMPTFELARGGEGEA